VSAREDAIDVAALLDGLPGLEGVYTCGPSDEAFHFAVVLRPMSGVTVAEAHYRLLAAFTREECRVLYVDGDAPLPRPIKAERRITIDPAERAAAEVRVAARIAALSARRAREEAAAAASGSHGARGGLESFAERLRAELERPFIPGQSAHELFDAVTRARRDRAVDAAIALEAILGAQAYAVPPHLTLDRRELLVTLTAFGPACVAAAHRAIAAVNLPLSARVVYRDVAAFAARYVQGVTGAVAPSPAERELSRRRTARDAAIGREPRGEAVLPEETRAALEALFRGATPAAVGLVAHTGLFEAMPDAFAPRFGT
jgi:hypothetical protein